VREFISLDRPTGLWDGARGLHLDLHLSHWELFLGANLRALDNEEIIFEAIRERMPP
jgi:hypothetical protein